MALDSLRLLVARVSAANTLASRYLNAARDHLQRPVLDTTHFPEVVVLRQRYVDELARLDGDLRLSRSEALLTSRRPASALEVLAPLLDSAGYPFEVRDSARILRDRVDALTARSDSGFAVTLVRGAAGATSTLLSQAIYILAISMMIVLVYWVLSARRLKPGIRLVVEDRTVDEAQIQPASRRLAWEIQDSIAKATSRSSAQVETSWDLDGGGAAGIQSDFSVIQQIDAIIKEAEPVSVAGAKFSLDTVWKVALAALQRPFAAELHGALTSSDVTHTLFLTRIERRSTRERHSKGPWTASGSDRTTVVGDVAVRYVFGTATWRPSDDLHSFEAHARGIRALLEPAPSADQQELSLNKAREWFTAAVRHDPTNWLARFRLAETLRKLGLNRSSLDELERLLQLVDRDPGQRPPSLTTFLEREPEFRDLLRYHIALTLGKLPEESSRQRALGVLRALQDERPTEKGGLIAKGLNAIRSDRDDRAWWRSEGAGLDLLVLSAEASTRAGIMELIRGMGTPEGRKEEFQAHVDRIEGILETIQKTTPGDGPAAESWEAALAVSANSAGRAAHHRGDFDGAIQRFNLALSTLAVIPDPYVGRASAMFRRYRPLGGHERQVEEDLMTAALLSPKDPKVYHYLGKLARERGDHASAIKHFAKAEALDTERVHPWTLFQHAESVLDGGGDPVEAIELLARSVEALPRADYRSRRLVETVVEAVKAGVAKPEHVEAARRALADLAKAPEERFKKWSARLQADFDGALKSHPLPKTQKPSK